MLTDIIRYTAFTVFLLVLLPYSVIAIWGIFAWTKDIVTKPSSESESDQGADA
jgi:hypothetical protein